MNNTHSSAIEPHPTSAGVATSPPEAPKMKVRAKASLAWITTPVILILFFVGWSW